MRKSNWTFVVYTALNLDLLFWIVLENLFLTTVKGLSVFDVVLVTTLGLGFSLVLYPITSFVIKKTNNHTAIIIGSIFNCLPTLLFTFSSSIFEIILGQIIYNVATQFKIISYVMLKNNLKEQNKYDEFVKWQSYGKLGYSIVTLIVSLVAGLVFNINPYLPMLLTFIFSIVGLVFAIIYKDTPKPQQENQASNNIIIKGLLKNKVMLTILFMNLLAVGTYTFLQTKGSLTIQTICESANLELSAISLIVSGIVFGSRLIRVISNMIFPKIYSKIENKPKILITISILIMLSNVFLAIGANIPTSYISKLTIFSIGFYIILSIRDIYSSIENKIIASNFHGEEQKQAFVLTNIYQKSGRLIIHTFALLFLGILPLKTVLILILLFSTLQLFFGFKMSKYLNT